MITLADFKKLDLRVAKVLEATLHPKADRLLVLKVDIGGGEVRQIVAGIRPFYPTPEMLVGKSVIVVANLESAVLRGVESQGMLLAASVESSEPPVCVPISTGTGSPAEGAPPDAPPRRVIQELTLLTPEKPLPPGSKVS